MKVVLLAGGLGTRLREETEFRPKPMVEIGGKPVLWHIMKIFASQGHNDFIVATGYKSDFIKDYFLNFQTRTNDFSIMPGKFDSLQIHGNSDELSWKVTVCDTGLETQTSGRVKRVEKYINGEDFMCTYGDGLADINLAELIKSHERSGKIATVTAVQPISRFGVLEQDEDGTVLAFSEKPQSSSWINAGFFVFKNKVFDYLDQASMLEEAPMHNLVAARQLNSYRHSGFWQPMDTLREAQMLNAMWQKDAAPWKTWE